MKRTLFVLGAVGSAAVLIAACGGGHQGAATAPMSPPSSTSQSLDTAQVLALAQQTSETSAPIAVNDGALALNDTSETSAPIAVNAK